MADEATIRSSLAIRKDDGSGNVLLEHSTQPTAFNADVTGTKGPVPGAVTITTQGVNIDLSELTTPGLCRFMNNDANNYVTYGIMDPETSVFYPLGEIRPGETYVLRLSRDLAQEFGTGTGTGTTGPETNRLRFRANAASVVVMVEAFEV